jgi:hypothetical protein
MEVIAFNGYKEEQGGAALTATMDGIMGAAGVDILHKLWRILFFFETQKVGRILVVFNTLVNFSKLLWVLKNSFDLQVFFRVSMTIL